MVFLLLVSVLFSRTPYLPFIDGRYRWAVKFEIVSASTHQLMSQQSPHFVHTIKLKPIIKAQISGKLVTSGISDVAIASVNSEKTRMKKMIILV